MILMVKKDEIFKMESRQSMAILKMSVRDLPREAVDFFSRSNGHLSVSRKKLSQTISY